MEPILAEAAASVAAEEGLEGEDGQAGGTTVPPSGKDGRGTADRAPTPEDQAGVASSHPAAGEM